MSALVIRGRIVTMEDGAASGVVAGRVWVRDDAIVAVTEGDRPLDGFDDASVIDAGENLVLPGLIDMHNHLGYGVLPLWSEPGRVLPWLHNKQWPDADTYTERVTEPAWTFVNAAPEAVLAYVQLRLMIGGATCAQGWPSANRGYRTIVRNVDSEHGSATVPEPFFTSVVTKTGDQLRDEVTRMNNGSGFIYHCAEGQRGSRVLRDYTELAGLQGLLPTFIGIHCCAVDSADWPAWPVEQAGGIVWSPLSNLVLYAQTTLVADARARGVSVCLGSDWGPSGTKNLLGEMKVARIASDLYGYGLSDADIVEMVTANAGRLLERTWRRPVGRLVAGGFADLTILRPRGTGDVWSQIVRAREADVALVVIGGTARYGDAKFMTAAGAQAESFAMTIAGRQRRVALADPTDAGKPWSWAAIKATLDQIQKDPKAAIDAVNARKHNAGAGLRSDPDASLELFLEMPDSRRSGRAGPPKRPEDVTIEPVPSLVHDAAFFTRLEAQPIHGHRLDPLRTWWT
jgi:cytosine/adenosine deaminase-related metal-dependent hydrolase